MWPQIQLQTFEAERKRLRSTFKAQMAAQCRGCDQQRFTWDRCVRAADPLMLSLWGFLWFDVVSPGRGFYKELRTGNRKGAIKIARILIQKSRYFLEEDKKCSANSCWEVFLQLGEQNNTGQERKYNNVHRGCTQVTVETNRLEWNTELGLIWDSQNSHSDLYTSK